jgi:uncharacterized membrane protein
MYPKRLVVLRVVLCIRSDGLFFVLCYVFEVTGCSSCCAMYPKRLVVLRVVLCIRSDGLFSVMRCVFEVTGCSP